MTEAISLHSVYICPIIVHENQVSWKHAEVKQFANTSFFISFYIRILKIFTESLSRIKTHPTQGHIRAQTGNKQRGYPPWVQHTHAH